MTKLKIKRVRNIPFPKRAHTTDAGLDLYLPEEVFVEPLGTIKVPLGLCLELEDGYMAQVIERSSIGAKGVVLGKSPIDAGYTGEIHAIIMNTNNFAVRFNAMDRIAQLVITKIETPEIVEVDTITKETERGDKGFGSSDKK